MLDSPKVQPEYCSFVSSVFDRKDNVSLEFRIFGHFVESRDRME